MTLGNENLGPSTPKAHLLSGNVSFVLFSIISMPF